MSFQIRPLVWSDYAVCRALCDDCFVFEDYLKFIKMWKKRRETGSFVATWHGSIVGFVLVRKDDFIGYIGVHPVFQNQKLGSRLLSEAMKVLETAPVVRLLTPPDLRLVQWYQRHGFEVEEHSYNGVVWEGATMIRRLKGGVLSAIAKRIRDSLYKAP
jgi:ribosomal protein S18 acetylase RimI-like enzyme